MHSDIVTLLHYNPENKIKQDKRSNWGETVYGPALEDTSTRLLSVCHIAPSSHSQIISHLRPRHIHSDVLYYQILQTSTCYFSDTVYRRECGIEGMTWKWQHASNSSDFTVINTGNLHRNTIQSKSLDSGICWHVPTELLNALLPCVSGTDNCI